MIKESLALRLGMTEANRDWIDGLSGEYRIAAQWAAQGEPVDEGLHTVTTWGAYVEFMDKPRSFDAFFSLAGSLRLVKDQCVGVNVWVRPDDGCRLQHG